MQHFTHIVLFVFFSVVNCQPSDYRNLTDNTFCEYVRNWSDHAESVISGFKTNIPHICKDEKYIHEHPGLFCPVLNSLLGNGESWCESYASCQLDPKFANARPEFRRCVSKSGKTITDFIECEKGQFKGKGICLDIGGCSDDVYCFYSGGAAFGLSLKSVKPRFSEIWVKYLSTICDGINYKHAEKGRFCEWINYSDKDSRNGFSTEMICSMFDSCEWADDACSEKKM